MTTPCLFEKTRALQVASDTDILATFSYPVMVTIGNTTGFVLGYETRLNLLNPETEWLGNFNMAWWWGTFTFGDVILFGLLREKTESVVAPGVLHGLETVGEGLAFLF